jgi:TonB-linked SusC/RagA family outer membrane protein
MDELFDPANVTRINIAASGGSEQGRYRLSANYLNQEGAVIYTGYERASTRLNSEFKLSDKLRIGQKLNVTFDKETPLSTSFNMPLQSSPLTPVYDTLGNFAGPYSNATGLSNASNVVAVQYRGRNDYNKNLRVIGDIFVEWDITPELTFKTLGAIQMRDLNGRNFNALNPEDPEPNTVNTLSESQFRQSDWNVSNTLNYKNVFGDHTLDVLVGTEAVKNSIKGHAISRTDYLFEDPSYYLLSNAAGQPVVQSGYENSTSIFSIFGTANYSYQGKYFATVTVRNDETSRFAQATADATFPSVSGAWLVSSEDWFDSSVFDTFKIRASYGELGNQQIGVSNADINISSVSEFTAFYAFQGSGQAAAGANLNSKGNSLLTWETTIKQNIAFDMGFFDNKLTATIDVWKDTTKDLVSQDTQAISTTAIDASAPYVNLGELENAGFDLSLNYSDVTSNGLQYSISGNFTRAKNEITSLISPFYTGGGSRVGPMTRTEVGQPISFFYGRKVLGIFQTQAEVAASAQPDAAPGRFIYDDLNNDGVINDEDRQKIGDPHPDLIFGLNINLNYKNWDLSAFMNGTLGNDIFNFEALYYESPYFFEGSRSTAVLDSWRPDNTDAKLPALSETIQNNEFTTANSHFVRDGSYLRLRTLQIGYTLPDSFASKLGASSARVYYNGTNLFTITDYDGYDPEIPRFGSLDIGVASNSFPTNSISSLGINIKF